MTKYTRHISAIITLVMVASMTASAALWIQPATAINPEPGPTQSADVRPQTVRVIVQKAGQGSQAERLVEELGGQVLKDLHIINAFAAELPASMLGVLEDSGLIRWVSIDAPVAPSALVKTMVRDEFNQASLDNNDGTVPWAGSWMENDVIGPGLQAGNVWVYGGELYLGDRPDTGTEPSMARQVDLSGDISGAILSFDYRTTPGVDPSDSIAIEISADGGWSYTTLEIIDHISGETWGTRSYDISSYLSAETIVRIRVLSYFGGGDEHFVVDNIQIAYQQSVPENTHLETTGADQIQALGITGQGITVAIVDSGIDPHADLSGRILAAPLSPGDVYGHGTHVAGIIGGDGSASSGVYNGIAPEVNFINLQVSDNTGMAYESDVVAALQWILENKDLYNIRVVNLSLNSVVEDSYHNSPMNAAAEILWFNGTVVVVSAGNKGPGGGHNTAKTAPANDPFFIAVGASDEHDTPGVDNDTIAPFSSFGITVDGFSKPDIIAPGYNIFSALASNSTWDEEHPDRVVLNGQYIRLSGTSMAAPMVTGAAALLLQDEPDLTPDQVKFRLLNASKTISGDQGVVYPYLDIYAAVTGSTTDNANTGLQASQLLWTGDEPITWNSVNWNSVNWNSVNWNSVNWNSVNWNSAKLDGIFWGGRKKK